MYSCRYREVKGVDCVEVIKKKNDQVLEVACLYIDIDIYNLVWLRLWHQFGSQFGLQSQAFGTKQRRAAAFNNAFGSQRTSRISESRSTFWY